MPSEQIQRSTAKVVKISDIHNSQYTKQEGFAPNYVIINGEQVSRVNIIGTVISADEKSVSVDDGNSSITVREFDTSTLNGIFLGDVVLVIGKIKEYGNQKYILPEIVKKTDIGWLRYRNAELKLGKVESIQSASKSISSQVKQELKPKVEEEVVEEAAVEKEEETTDSKILNYIRKNDKDDDGVLIDDILQAENVTEDDIENLLKSGDIFLVKPGKVKVLE